MISCKEVAQEAHELLDGDVGFVRRLEIRFHLFICKYCRRYVNQLKVTLRTLRETDVLEQAADQTEPSEAEIDAIVARLKRTD